jgi:hypothetical protein
VEPSTTSSSFFLSFGFCGSAFSLFIHLSMFPSSSSTETVNQSHEASALYNHAADPDTITSGRPGFMLMALSLLFCCLWCSSCWFHVKVEGQCWLRYVLFLSAPCMDCFSRTLVTGSIVCIMEAAISSGFKSAQGSVTGTMSLLQIVAILVKSRLVCSRKAMARLNSVAEHSMEAHRPRTTAASDVA